ncbi:hypothetical protein G5C65_03605 [Streptomyces sp. SB3404]|uniref:Helix-turn-helix domain-containing protein n=1 Tax=Streptomyces boncukensis TaxID=2711219 RepID=A0A6G4WSC5_9ACTN|nr:hypothetical protein [Streptomyces boncukensis]
MSGAQRTQLAHALRAHYDTGLTVRDIANATSRSYQGVHALLKLAGTRFRSKGSPGIRRRRTP